MSFNFFAPRNGHISEYFAECASQTAPKPTRYSEIILELSDAGRAELENEAGDMSIGEYVHRILFDPFWDPDM